MGSRNDLQGYGLSNKVEAEELCKNKQDDLNIQLWHACAGPLVNVPSVGDKVFYFPQGHIEQVEAYINQDGKVEMPVYYLPSKILCKVVYVQVKAEAYTDEVFAQITLLPQQEEPSPQRETSQSNTRKVNVCSFSKILTPSDTSTHGGFSVPKRHADECFPPLDMSKEPPVQELVANDLHGFQWRFRHIYRGQPKRHLLTSGWSSFVGAKKLVAGDACTFLRGENGELFIGICRATKPQINASASVLSGHSMQHGILASACHAMTTGTMFTVYYRPWTSPAEFIVPLDQYMKSAEIDYSIGTRFRMKFEGDDGSEPKCSRIAGTVVGIDDKDPIRWPGSEWRCLKVQWDVQSETHVLPERVSPWSIEPMVLKKKKKCASLLPNRKRARPLDTSTPGFPVLAGDGLLKYSVDCTPKIHLGVLQGQEIRAMRACELGGPHLIPQPNPDWLDRQVGPENQQHHFRMHDPFHHSHGGTMSIPFGNPPNTGSVSQDWKVTEEKKDEIEAPMGQQKGNDKCMLFGVNIFSSSPVELSSQQVVSSSSELLSQDSDKSKGSIPEKKCKNCCSAANRSCTKVLKYGSALGRSVDLAHFDGYDELIRELDQMFDFNGTLIDRSSGWYITYTDGEGDMMLIGDYPWLEFRAMVRKMFICPKEDVDKLDPSSPDPPLS